MNTNTTEISSSDDIIDSRDVIARMEWLRSFCEDENGEILTPETCPEENENMVEIEEYTKLAALAEDGENYSSDWTHGATLIRDSYFQDYAKDLAEDIGAIDRNASWPLGCIDWEAAADELKSDYSAIEFDGVTYWVR
jgi:hypothetical protein